MPTAAAPEAPYLSAYNGRLRGVLRWHDLDALWAQLLRLNDGGWFVYAIGDAPPTEPASSEEFSRRLAGIRARLRDEHQEDYCGIVYADDLQNPGFVKVFDPANLGMVCGSSAAPTLPGWTLSRVPPDDLRRVFAQRGPRRRWWEAIFR